MIRHLVLFTFVPETPAGQPERITAALSELPAAIPAIRAYAFGPDLGLREGNAAYAVSALVDDEAGLAGYLDHPEHRRVVAAEIAPWIATRTAAQIKEAQIRG